MRVWERDDLLWGIVRSPDDMSSRKQQGIGARATASFQRQKGEGDREHTWRGSEPHATHCPAAFIAAPSKSRYLVSSGDVAGTAVCVVGAVLRRPPDIADSEVCGRANLALKVDTFMNMTQVVFICYL